MRARGSRVCGNTAVGGTRTTRTSVGVLDMFFLLESAAGSVRDLNFGSTKCFLDKWQTRNVAAQQRKVPGGVVKSEPCRGVKIEKKIDCRS